MSRVINHFCDFYRGFSCQPASENLGSLGKIYSDDVLFEDPVHKIKGLDKLSQYFSGMFEDLCHCHFEIDSALEQEGQAYVRWTMTYAHPKLAKGKDIKVSGVSYLQFDEYIFFHRDYLDMGNMIYEHIPILGIVIRKIKQGISK